MAASIANTSSLRSPALLTRSWLLTPSYINFRAGKHSGQSISFAYRVFTEIPHHNIPRSRDPFHICTIRQNGRRTTRHNTRVPVRKFHRSSARQSAKDSAIPHISMHIAASSSGKGSKFQAEKSTYDYDGSSKTPLGLQKDGLTIFQKRRARPDSGQDAYFVAAVGKDSEEMAFGICDGVGGWSDHGVDPADFSHGLCSHMAQIALEWTPTSKDQDKLKPQQLLEEGYQATVKDPQIKAGGSTACIAITNPDGRMRIANLGDSGFIQLRSGKVQHYSNPQTHAFNTPYQMSLTPPEILAQAMIFGGLPLNDLPERADTTDQMLKHGDVLVLATDGLWDNLSSQDVLNIVSTQMRQAGAWQRTSERGFVVTDGLASLTEKSTATSRHNLTGTIQSVVAAALVGEAKSASLNRKRDGPFAKAWQKQIPYDPFHGGKVDDITVLVVIPVANKDSKTGETSAEGQPVKAKL